MLVEHETALAVQRGLKVNKAQVNKLIFCGSKFPANSMASILQGLKDNETVESDRFNNSRFLIGAANELTKTIGFCHRIKKLELFHCGLSDDDAARLVTSLEHHPSLKHLDLGHNNCASKTLEAIGNNLLVHTPALHTLNLALQHTRLERLYLDIAQMTSGLAQNKTLKVL